MKPRTTKEGRDSRTGKSLVGDCVIAYGKAGICVWDEGGDSVVVEFDHEVPNNGYPCNNPRQAWVPRIHISPGHTHHNPPP